LILLGDRLTVGPWDSVDFIDPHPTSPAKFTRKNPQKTATAKPQLDALTAEFVA